MIWVKGITEKGIESIACQVSQPLIFVTFIFLCFRYTQKLVSPMRQKIDIS